ncbi:MAG: deoxyribose-phosphate aldolase [Prevotellaceae bacterium]|jgi:deoxyribose-phosphate aldolase|nr:deoxyribose-phosphate aldolase [Prevotellaceae bacterium]
MTTLNHFLSQYDGKLNDADVQRAVNELLTTGFDKNNTKEVYRTCLSLIDLTSLNATDTEEKIADMVRKVNLFPETFPELDNVAAICVYPSLTPIARKTLSATGVNIAAVSAGFPSSQTFIEAKVAEVALTVQAGADEVDVVQSLGKFFSGSFEEVCEELSELKAACRQAHLKVILESGALHSAQEVKQASLIAIAAGADFIKTSTGKTDPAATLEAAYVMCSVIRDYYEKTGIKIGFKPAGGIVSTEDAVKFYTIVNALLGKEWMTKQLFRFGASRLANNLLSSILDREVVFF